MKQTITRKLWLTFGLLVLTMASGAVVSYWQLGRIEKDLLKVVDTEEPLHETILEMEIHVGETARAVLDYVRNLDPKHIEKANASKANYERFTARFDKLAERAEEKRLGQEVAQLYAEFKVLSDEIPTLVNRRFADLQLFRENVKKVEELVLRRLRKTTDRFSGDAIKKREALLNMEINIDKALIAIDAYIVQRSPALRQEFLDTEANFKRFLAMSRLAGVSGDDEIILDQIEESFVESVNVGNEIIAITTKLYELLKRFEMDLEKIDRILDDQIQPLIRAETARATEEAKESTATAVTLLVVIGVIGTLIGSLFALGISRGIVKPVEALARGAELIGSGILDHKIDIKGKDEFRQLADNFNQMAANLKQSRETLQKAHGELQQRVEERTAELSESNELLKREIDEHERTEEALQKTNEELHNFVHVVSHDLKTPITLIQGFSSALLDKHKEGLDDQGRICLERIDASALRMERLVSDLLDLAKVEKVVATFEDISSVEIVTNVISSLQERLNAKGIELIVEDNFPTINCDKERIYQVFDNLLVNAMKFTGDSENSQIKIGYEDTGDFHQFQVRDNGIGIAPEDHLKIFEKFHRLKQVEDEQGTGLGLAIVERIISEHGGQIWVESKKERGATFYFTLAKKLS